MKPLFQWLRPRAYKDCHCLSCATHDQMYTLIPLMWYEKPGIDRAVYYGLALGGVFLQIGLKLYPNFWFTVCGVFLCVLGEVVDTYTTWLSGTIKPLFDDRGLDFPLVELNPLLPENPTLKGLIFGVRNVLFLLLLFLVLVVPSVGIAFGVVKLLVGLGNWREKQRALAALHAIDQMRRQGPKVGYSSSS